MKKRRTIEQVETAQKRAITAAEHLLNDDDLADELSDLTPEEYAERKGIEIIENTPHKALKPKETHMTIREYRQKLIEKDALITELQEENDELSDKLAEIKGLVTDADEEDEDEFEDEDESEDAEDDE